ncbi:MAG: glycosyltransferase family 2 protein [Sandaracinaceae bacterium]
MSKLRKFRNSPERFFADSKHPALRTIGRVVAPPLMRSARALALLEDPAQALVTRSIPIASAAARRIAARAHAARQERIRRAGDPLVSVIMPARNAANDIERALGSLLAQSHRALEVIVVDDASGDATSEIANRIAERDARVRVFRSEVAGGAAQARNRGLFESRGDYLTFQDADDESHPERIERQLAVSLERDAAVVVVNSIREMPDGRRAVINGRRFTKNVISMLLPRRPVFERVGYMRPLEVGEDSEYYERIKAVFGEGREVHLFQTLYRARFAEGSLLFSHGETRLSPTGDVEYIQADAVKLALDAALAELDAVRDGTKSPFVPYRP